MKPTTLVFSHKEPMLNRGQNTKFEKNESVLSMILPLDVSSFPLPRIEKNENKYKSLLLPHEKFLLEKNYIKNTTHKNANELVFFPKQYSMILPLDVSSYPKPRIEKNEKNEKNEKKYKYKSLLLPHEKFLLEKNYIKNTTHKNARAIHLSAPLKSDSIENRTRVYRPMADTECQYLMKEGILPSSQPYQAIIEGDVGFAYANKFLNGIKKVDTCPTTIVEFDVPKPLIKKLYDTQHKIEDGAISMGLGNKAGKGLNIFNDALMSGDSSFRIVQVKRKI